MKGSTRSGQRANFNGTGGLGVAGLRESGDLKSHRPSPAPIFPSVSVVTNSSKFPSKSHPAGASGGDGDGENGIE